MKRFFKYLLENLISLIIVATGYHFYYLNRFHKELKISLVNSVIEKYSESIEKTLSSNLADSISIIDIEVKNSGNQPLIKPDFSTELTFNTGSLELLDFKILNPKPTNLHIDFRRLYKNEIRLNPILFNPKDKFTVQIKTNGVIDTLFSDVRIIGARKINLNITKNIQNQTKLVLKDLDSYRELKIIRATYGFSNRTIDVTEKLNKNIRNNSVEAFANSEIDPYPNKIKILEIKYYYGGFVDSVKIIEGKSLKLPILK